MVDTKELKKMVERALLVSAYNEKDGRADAESLLEELAELVNTLGVPIVDQMLIHLRDIQPRYLLGSGKAEEVVAHAKALSADVIIFDNQLSPSQQRNWEALAPGIIVIDRTEVILDIFAQRARTREARMQIELARLEHSLPRLTRAWTHLVRQGGGIGARGEGETQLEQDKRRIRGQIDRLKEELEEVRSARATQRKDRKRTPVPNAAIVGYTNAGKSSLLRLLTGADVLVEDKLFATLDTTTRKVQLPNKRPLLLTDTVGFVRKLPHQLVESFNATLEEAGIADFLIHVLDASAERVTEFYDTTLKVLHELGTGKQPTLVVFNKIDRLEDPAIRNKLALLFPEAIFVSVLTGEGVPEMVERISEFVSGATPVHEFWLPQSASEQLARLHRQAKVIELEYVGNDVRIVCSAPPRLIEDFQEYIVDEPAEQSARRAAVIHETEEETVSLSETERA